MNTIIFFRNHIAYIKKAYTSTATNWVVLLSSGIMFFSFLCALSLIIWKWSSFPPNIPLWYAKPWGDDQLAHPGWLFLLPIGMVVWYIIDICVAAYTTLDYLIFSQLLFATSAIVSILSLITLLNIISVIT